MKLSRKKIYALSVLALACQTANAVPYERMSTLISMKQNSAEIIRILHKNAADTSKDMHTSLMDMANTINTATIVEAQQKQANATTISDADMKNREKVISAENAKYVSKKIAEVQADYGALTGQGYRVCSVVKDSKAMAQASREAREIAGQAERSTANAGGKLANRLDAINARTAVHREHFCNENDVAQGNCEAVSNYANADVNANSLYTSAKVGSTTDIAKDLVRENIIGQAPMTIPAESGRSALGQAYLYAQNQQTALKAMPNYALSYIQAYTTVRDDIKDAKGNPISPQQQSQAIVGRYYGGDEAKEWIKTLTVQRPRGLLVELSQAQDVMIWQLNQLNEMSNIEIATKASGLLALSETEDKKLAKQYERLKRSTIQNNMN